MKTYYVSSSNDMFEHVINWILQNKLTYKVIHSGIRFDLPQHLAIEFNGKWNAYCSEVKE